MSCETIRPLLLRSAEGEAHPHEALAVARHLSDCTACRIHAARERRLGEHLENDLEDLPVSEDFIREVMDRIGTLPPPRRRERLKLAALAGLGVGAAALIARLGPTIDPAGLRAGLAAADGPAAIDGSLGGTVIVVDAVRMAVDSAATLLPAAGSGGGALMSAAAAAVLVVAGAIGVGSTIIALAAGSVLRLVR